MEIKLETVYDSISGKSIERDNQSKHPLVSIIIPTKNSQGTLRICLESIQAQTYRYIETIVVDSYSRDRTREIAIKYGAKVVTKDCRMTAARNYGASFAKGEYLYHMDSDMKLSPRVVEECVKACQMGADAVVVPQIFDGVGFFGKCRALEFYCIIDDEMLKIVRFVRKSVFEKINGYDGNLEAGEDWDFTQRIAASYRLARISSYVVHGWGRYDIANKIIKCINYGKTVKLYVTKHPQYAKYQWGILRFMRLDYRKLRRDPMHTVGLLFIKTCEFAAGWLGMMIL